MIAVLQRVKEASVKVDGEVVGAVGPGLLVLLAVCKGDSEAEMVFLCNKMADLRIFPDEGGRMNRSLSETGGELLMISQFTLCADWVRGRRPGFTKAADPAVASAMIDQAVQLLRDRDIHVETGIFGAEMDVQLINDGPVTLILDSKEKFTEKG